jgi:hypothetical protein
MWRARAAIDLRIARRDACHPARSARRPVAIGRKKLQWVDVDASGESLDDLQGQVSLASLDSSEVRAVYAELLGKRFLADAAALAVRAQAAPECPLQLAFHQSKAAALLLYSLQTDKYHLRRLRAGRACRRERQTLPVAVPHLPPARSLTGSGNARGALRPSDDNRTQRFAQRELHRALSRQAIRKLEAFCLHERSWRS